MSSRAEWDLKTHQRACCGNAEALNFLGKWASYVHNIDDAIDGDVPGPEHLLATFAQAIEIYSHPYYLRHISALKPIAIMITSTYADSVEFERSDVEWKRQWADQFRHVGKVMVEAVATLCGGYDTLRSVSQELNAMCHGEYRIGEKMPENNRISKIPVS